MGIFKYKLKKFIIGSINKLVNDLHLDPGGKKINLIL